MLIPAALPDYLRKRRLNLVLPQRCFCRIKQRQPDTAAGGIVGQAFAGNINITIKNCLALTTAGVKALGNTSDKQAGRIVGSDPPTNKLPFSTTTPVP